MKCKNAVILAGGKSRRMKFDKQDITIDNKKLIFITIEKLRKIFENITIVTNSPEKYKDKNVDIISDIYPGFGPISGIHTALVNSKQDLIYVIACDMPYINLEYIKYMDEKYSYDKDGIITLKGGYIEPMNSIYNKSLIQKIEMQIKNKEYRISELVNKSDFVKVDEDVASAIGIGLKMFRNMNTPEDLQELMMELGNYK